MMTKEQYIESLRKLNLKVYFMATEFMDGRIIG